jgi:hypothetical protein
MVSLGRITSRPLLRSHAPIRAVTDLSSGVTPKASVDGLGTGSPENLSGAAEKTNHTDNLAAASDDRLLVRRREGR